MSKYVREKRLVPNDAGVLDIEKTVTTTIATSGLPGVIRVKEGDIYHFELIDELTTAQIDDVCENWGIAFRKKCEMARDKRSRELAIESLKIARGKRRLRIWEYSRHLRAWDSNWWDDGYDYW